MRDTNQYNTVMRRREPPGLLFFLIVSLTSYAFSQTLAPAAVPYAVRKLLPKNALDQWWFRSRLAASSNVPEYFVVYHTSRAALAFDPHVVWLHEGKVQFSEQLDSDAEFSGAREFHLDSTQNAMAVAFHFASDRSGTWFRIYGGSGSTLVALQDFQVVEGQLQIIEDPSSARLRIWQEAGACKEGESFCVWCLHRYRIDEYRWAGPVAQPAALRAASNDPPLREKLPAFYLLSRSNEPGCRDPKELHRTPILGVAAPPSVAKGIEGEP